jgi:hypothetical protein
MYSSEIDYQLTVWDRPHSVVRSTNGPKLYSQWLVDEMDRILKNPERKAKIVHRDRDGRMALFVNGFNWTLRCQCNSCQMFAPTVRKNSVQ